MGRHSKLTPDRQQRILDAIEAGQSLETAAVLGGVSRRSVFRWRAERPAFKAATERAEAVGETARVARIAQAGERGAWQADAWLLERRWPDRWGRRRLF